MDSYDDKTGIFDALGDAVPTFGGENFNRMWETVVSHRTYFLQSLPELSYIPEKPRLDVMDMPYAYWDIQKMMSILRKRESKQFWYFEKLSYFPEE